ncbi:MAG: CPBP family intramembrane glutamic endopeptidase [Bauldia sp.]
MFWPATLALSAAALIGVVALAAATGGPVLKAIPVANPVLKRVVLGIQPATLAVVFAAVGSGVAAGAGSKSIIADWAAGAPIAEGAFAGFLPALFFGIAGGFLLFGADRLTRPLWSPERDGPDAVAEWQPGSLVAGVFYGGITEEVMMRWGIMGLFLWILVSLFGTPGDPGTIAVIVAVLLSALVFAAGHLPAAFAMGRPTRGFVVRTLALNTIAGIAFGWLFWAWNLETAMVAHAAFHVGAAGFVLLMRATGPPNPKEPPEHGS